MGIGFFKRKKKESEKSFLLAGRTVTLPAFIATLVATWYGGILGIGEYTFQFGVSQWVLFGAPYYLFALLFALFLSGRIQKNKALTIPEAISASYHPKAGAVSAILIFLLVNPAPYILMLGMLFRFFTGWDLHILFFAAFGALFSVIYVSVSGFRAVLRTDMLQAVLMYTGFAVLLFMAFRSIGTPVEIWQQIPDTHKDFTGGHPFPYLMVWFFIALWTFVDPSFHQRAASAKSPETARKGIFISILFWFVFDLFMLFAALYGVVMLGEMKHPLLVYPEMGAQLLPVGLSGLFFLALLATIMSTLDSYLFLSGQTLGRDLLAKYAAPNSGVALTRWCMLLSAVLALLLISIYPGVVALWYAIGSALIPGLLIPVLGIYLPFFKIQPRWVAMMLILPCVISAIWLALGTWHGDSLYQYSFLGVEPFYPGFTTALVIWLFSRKKRNKAN